VNQGSGAFAFRGGFFDQLISKLIPSDDIKVNARVSLRGHRARVVFSWRFRAPADV
jgi:hypothetical protein